MLQAGFILLTLALAITLYLMVAKTALKAFTDQQQQRNFIRKTALVIVCWLVYICVISVTGICTNTGFPPRIPLLLVIPSFLLFIYLLTNSNFQRIIAHTPAQWLVYFQSFRIVVELLLWGLFMKGILPQSATFEGHNFDILIGLTAPLIAYFTFTKRGIPNPLFILWNFAGLITLVVVVFTLMHHAYFPPIKDEPNILVTKGIGILPFTFLAGFFMPLAVFIHVLSLIKAKERSA